MGNLPCEYILWYGIPVIRKELAICLIKNYGLNQRETAEKLGVTPAAICQYLSKKRGRITIIDKQIVKEINKSAKEIIEHGEPAVNSHICKICKLLKSEGMFKFQIVK
jgi:predicted transcriptional regulator